MAGRKKGRNPCFYWGSRPFLDVLGAVDGGGGGNRTPVRRHSMPGTTCLAHRSISPCGNTVCEAHRRAHPLKLSRWLAGRRQGRFRDDDPTSTSTGTSGFGAYALSGESVDVVVGVWVFAAGLTRKATPSACAERFRDPRRSQCTPGKCRYRRPGQYRGRRGVHKPGGQDARLTLRQRLSFGDGARHGQPRFP